MEDSVWLMKITKTTYLILSSFKKGWTLFALLWIAVLTVPTGTLMIPFLMCSPISECNSTAIPNTALPKPTRRMLLMQKEQTHWLYKIIISSDNFLQHRNWTHLIQNY